jgi:hypothetical protein
MDFLLTDTAITPWLDWTKIIAAMIFLSNAQHWRSGISIL